MVRLLLSWPYTSIEPNDRGLRVNLRSGEWVTGPEFPETLHPSPRPAPGNTVVQEKEALAASDEWKSQWSQWKPMLLY